MLKCGRGGLGIIGRYKDWEAGRGRIKNGGSGYKQWYYGRGRKKSSHFPLYLLQLLSTAGILIR